MSVVLCANRLADRTEMEEALVHELVHVYDVRCLLSFLCFMRGCIRVLCWRPFIQPSNPPSTKTYPMKCAARAGEDGPDELRPAGLLGGAGGAGGGVPLLPAALLMVQAPVR